MDELEKKEEVGTITSLEAEKKKKDAGVEGNTEMDDTDEEDDEEESADDEV